MSRSLITRKGRVNESAKNKTAFAFKLEDLRFQIALNIRRTLVCLRDCQALLIHSEDLNHTHDKLKVCRTKLALTVTKT
jgi:hypothetical protein